MWFCCVGGGISATGFYFDGVVAGLAGTAGKVGGAEVLEVVAVYLAFWCVMIGVAGGAGGAATVGGCVGGGAKLWMDAVGFDGIIGSSSTEVMMLRFLIVVEVDEVFFIGVERAARGNNFASRHSRPWRWVHTSDGFVNIDVDIGFVYDFPANCSANIRCRGLNCYILADEFFDNIF